MVASTDGRCRQAHRDDMCEIEHVEQGQRDGADAPAGDLAIGFRPVVLHHAEHDLGLFEHFFELGQLALDLLGALLDPGYDQIVIAIGGSAHREKSPTAFVKSNMQ